MKLFSVPNGQIDHTDRAQWLTQPFDNPSAGNPRFHLFDIITMRRLTVFADAARSADISGLLPEGLWTLALMREDVYGYRSSLVEEDAQIQILVDSEGNVSSQLQGVEFIESEPLASGYVRVRWGLESKQSWMRVPTQIQIALQSDPSIVLTTLTFDATDDTADSQADIGPFDDGQTVVPLVRSKDATDSQNWVVGEPVTADASGPAAPTLV